MIFQVMKHVKTYKQSEKQSAVLVFCCGGYSPALLEMLILCCSTKLQKHMKICEKLCKKTV